AWLRTSDNALNAGKLYPSLKDGSLGHSHSFNQA
ncbi:unnamed protein product, partial [marine sediment metagenome]